MSSLPQVLHEAVTRGASEIIIESGELPLVRTEAGAVTVGDPLTESELFDALAQVLAPDQQAELAVGNVIEFKLDVEGGRWTLLTEPSSDGIVVRGHLQPDAKRASMGTPLDLPPLDPIELDSKNRVPRSPAPALSRPTRRTQWDLGLASDTPEPTPTPSPKVDSSATSGSPSWLVRNDGDREQASPAPFEAQEAEFELRTPTGEQPANLVDASEPEDDELPELLDPLAEVASEVVADLQALASRIEAGSLCLLQGSAAPGAELAGGLDQGNYTAIEDKDQELALRRSAELPPGTTFVISVEDPSACLGWMLRRAEEGSRIIVTTRALTGQGAVRGLLGLQAHARAEAWLAAHTTLWLAPARGGWAVRELDPSAPEPATS